MCTVLHTLWAYLFIIEFELGVAGAAMATTITYAIMTAATILISLTKAELRDAIFWPNNETYRNIGGYLRVAIPSTLMLCLEWWAYEVFTLLAGLISINSMAVEVILLNISTVIFMCTYGM